VEQEEQSPVLIARQPVVDRQRQLMGYEILFRGEDPEGLHFDGSRATAQVMTEELWLNGVREIVGNALAFINFPEQFLLSGYGSLLIPPEAFVVEVLETVAPSREVVAECRRLRRRGVRIALDDVIDVARIEAFEREVDFVKADLPACSPERLRELVDASRRTGAKAIAEKVESQEMLEYVLDLGFDYFQGYVLGRPAELSSRPLTRLPVQRARLLSVLSQPYVSLSELEEVVLADPALAYRVLAYANSATAAQRRRVDSIRAAIILFGQEEIRRVASLLVLSGITGVLPGYLLEESLVRARFCEGVAPLIGERPTAFRHSLCGLLSNLDALLGTTMDEVVRHIPLTEDIESALVDGEGNIGRVLNLARAYGRGDWPEVRNRADVMSIELRTLPVVYQTAVRVLRAFAPCRRWRRERAIVLAGVSVGMTGGLARSWKRPAVGQ
jgi:c-di-GMP-related signal transduction protein